MGTLCAKKQDDADVEEPKRKSLTAVRTRSVSYSSNPDNVYQIDDIKKLLEIVSMGDFYWREVIGDHLEDGIHDWHKIKQLLWGNINIDDNEVNKMWIQYQEYLEDKSNVMQQLCSKTKISKTPTIPRLSTKTSIPPLDRIHMGYSTRSFGSMSTPTQKRQITINNRKYTETKIEDLPSHTPASMSAQGTKSYNIPTRKLTITIIEDEKKSNITPNITPIITPNVSPDTKQRTVSIQIATPHINHFCVEYDYTNTTMTKSPETKHKDDTHNHSGNDDDEKKINITSDAEDATKNVIVDTLNSEYQNDHYQCCLSLSMPPNINTSSPSPEERKNNDMDKMSQLRAYCEPFKRIELVLEEYHKVINQSSSSQTKLSDKYQHQQLFDDFCHIKMMHIDGNNNKMNIGKEICLYFQRKYPCDVKQCNGFLRHYSKNINDENEPKTFETQKQERIIEDISFQRQLDSMHTYFLHSAAKFGIDEDQIDAEEANMMDEHGRYWKRRVFWRGYSGLLTPDSNNMNEEDSDSNNAKEVNENDEKQENVIITHHAYAGKKEDNLWWNDVVTDEDNKQSEHEMYKILAKNMGVFRWQNPHGFMPGQNQDTAHYKPKWKNIKEEALNNKYEQLSKDNWNQTLRKSTIFFKSWARQKIRTQYDSFFDDQVTGQTARWNVGLEITMQEVVTLKLYTDFDKLQFALKKCFRFETFEDILRKKLDQRAKKHEKYDDNELESIIATEHEYEKAKDDLQNRLENFYHWRGGLLIVLSKFGTKLNHENNMVLYHGVNAKMIIKSSQTFAFNGPLSTTSCYHVARTFATPKGMVLKLKSQFPRLNYCNAFDASLISDYPEEKEWLVGFMYARLLEVRARKLIDDNQPFCDLIDKIPLSSWIRQQFFVIHLFGEQIFSMSEHLERILAQFLKVNRRECCDKNQKTRYENECIYFKDWEMDIMCNQLCNHAHKTKKYEMKDDEKTSSKKNQTKEDIIREVKIVPILWKKFTEFREKPNFRQCIKFDTISDHLKRFFMEEIDEKDIETDENKRVISFDEITRVYPNVEEIHFMNHYKFDNAVLRNLMQQIEKENKNKIRKIVFLYYDYSQSDDQNKPSDFRIFQDPDTLNEKLTSKLIKLGWQIKHNKNGETGYKIRIYKNVNANVILEENINTAD